MITLRRSLLAAALLFAALMAIAPSASAQIKPFTSPGLGQISCATAQAFPMVPVIIPSSSGTAKFYTFACAVLSPTSFTVTPGTGGAPAVINIVPPSGSGNAPAWNYNEQPTGTIDGVNLSFVLAAAPSPAGSLLLDLNGIHLRPGVDYTLSGATITFLSGAQPTTGDRLFADYRTQ